MADTLWQGPVDDISVLKHAVRSNITALWQALLARRNTKCNVDMHTEIDFLVKDTLRPLVETENARQPVNQLPTELFLHVASFLGQANLWRAALICRSWRVALLGCPGLWAHISVTQGGCDNHWSTRSLALLDILFARSQRLPLFIELRLLDGDEYLHSPGFDACRKIAGLLAGEMYRVRSLSLILPDLAGTAFADAISMPAPIIACFRLYVSGSPEDLPEYLFGQCAPCLASLALSNVDLNPTGDYTALRSVQYFIHDARTICSRDIEAVSQLLPSLRSLTVFATRCNIDRSLAACTLPLHLRLPGIDTILDVKNVFPNASTACLSSSMAFSSHALRALFDTAGHPTLMDLSCCPTQLVDPKDPDEYASSGICIKLDGTDVAVDLGHEQARLCVQMLSQRLQGLRSIIIDDNLWQILVPQLVLPSLRDLTVHLLYPDGGDRAGWLRIPAKRKRNRKLGISLLRLVAPPDACVPPLEEGAVTQVVRAVADPDALRTLVLCGVELSLQSSGTLLSLVPHLQILHEYDRPAREASQPWFWTFPEAEAICI